MSYQMIFHGFFFIKVRLVLMLLSAGWYKAVFWLLKGF